MHQKIGRSPGLRRDSLRRPLPLFCRPVVKPLASILLALSLSGCAVVNLAVNRPPCCPPKDAPPLTPSHEKPPRHVWASFDGRRFPYLEALPPSPRKPKAVVILVPGWDGTTGDFRPLTAELVKHGYAVYGSEDRYQRYDPVVLGRGWASDWHAWVHDLQAFTQKVRMLQPGVPIYYHGHSMGCLIAVQATAGAQPQVDGLVLQSPAIAMMHDKESAFLKAAEILFFWARPPHLSGMYLMGKDLTGDRAWDCAWMSSSDRVHAGYTLHFFSQTLRMGHEALQTSRQLREQHLPVLGLEGGEDQAATILQPAGRLCEYITEDLRAEYKPYRNGHHLITAGEIENGKGGLVKDEAIGDIVRWLDGKVARPVRRPAS